MTFGDAAEVLVVRRQLPFPREQVFAAWLDGASLAQWMRGNGASRATVDVDPRVGGKFRIVMHMKQGAAATRAGRTQPAAEDCLSEIRLNRRRAGPTALPVPSWAIGGWGAQATDS
jgi:uncharacterized protein YndB with AHSA1/START domain